MNDLIWNITATIFLILLLLPISVADLDWRSWLIVSIFCGVIVERIWR